MSWPAQECFKREKKKEKLISRSRWIEFWMFMYENYWPCMWDKSVSSCTLVYSGMHLGQLEWIWSYFSAQIQTPQVSTSEMYTDLERAAVWGMPKLGMFLTCEFGLLSVFLDA
jgi:hypothetical protein